MKTTDSENRSVLEELDLIYQESGNKAKIDYWTPLAQMINECITERSQQNLTQADLARKMKTTQSVISRFENMGRTPNYDFMARLALALGHVPSFSILGEYSITLPPKNRKMIDAMARQKSISVKKLLEQIISETISTRTYLTAAPQEKLSIVANRQDDEPEVTMDTQMTDTSTDGGVQD